VHSSFAALFFGIEIGEGPPPKRNRHTQGVEEEEEVWVWCGVGLAAAGARRALRCDRVALIARLHSRPKNNVEILPSTIVKASRSFLPLPSPDDTQAHPS
jgi:hypothetical protein